MAHQHGDRVAAPSQVRAEDRWAIIAYVRALQLSEHATLSDVPREDREKLR